MVTSRVHHEGEFRSANAFLFVRCAQKNVALYLLTDDKPAMRNVRRVRASCGTVNGQPKMVARIRGVQSLKRGEIRRLEGQESDAARAYLRRFLRSPWCCQRRYGETGWMKLNSPTTRWGLQKLRIVTRLTRPAGVAPAVKCRQVVRRAAGHQLIFIDDDFPIVKFRARILSHDNKSALTAASLRPRMTSALINNPAPWQMAKPAYRC